MFYFISILVLMLISSLLSRGLTSNIADFFKLMYIDKGKKMMERKSGLMKDFIKLQTNGYEKPYPS
jgi:hypothetical protein